MRMYMQTCVFCWMWGKNSRQKGTEGIEVVNGMRSVENVGMHWVLTVVSDRWLSTPVMIDGRHSITSGTASERAGTAPKNGHWAGSLSMSCTICISWTGLKGKKKSYISSTMKGGFSFKSFKMAYNSNFLFFFCSRNININELSLVKKSNWEKGKILKP